MQLSPEERRRIYEEEKSRIDAEANKINASSITSLRPQVAGLLCYAGGWITGIIFLVLEQKNSFIRFHAAQSIIVFGSLNIIHILLNPVPPVGWLFSSIIGGFTLVLWIVLMFKAYQGELFKLPLAGELAEKLLGLPQGGSGQGYGGPVETRTPPRGAAVKPPMETGRTREDRWKSGRVGRIISSGFAIAWSFALLIFFNFFNQYIACYSREQVNGVSVWVRTPVLTGEFSSWLPVLTVALVVSMLGHVVLITIDKYVLREAVFIVLDLFGVMVVASLLSIFPFDFSPLPYGVIAGGAELGMMISLGLISFGLGIAVIVRLIKLTVYLVRGAADG